MKCDHLYGVTNDGVLITEDNYKLYNPINKFPYCPYCRAQLHTIEDLIPLGLPKDDEDCIRGGCED
jgi:hypothetical protein